MAVPAFVISIGTKLLEWAISKLAPIIVKAWKRLIRNVKINRETNKEVKAVRSAVEQAEQALKDCDECERVPSEQEKKLRNAVRRLSDSIYG